MVCGGWFKRRSKDALNSTDCLPPNTCTEIDLPAPLRFPFPNFNFCLICNFLLPAPSQLLPFNLTTCNFRFVAQSVEKYLGRGVSDLERNVL